MAEASVVRVGPVQLAPGISRFNFFTFLYASFICIGMLAGMNFLQPYVLTEMLAIPPREQGTVSGNLGTVQELIVLLLINPFGWLSDRIGRRPIMVFGIVLCGIGYGLYPFATSAEELLVYRMIFATGAAALAAVIAIVANDYPIESSRGKLIGFGNVMNGVGVLFMTGVVAQVPLLLRSQGAEGVLAGRAMFLFAAVLCIASAIVFRAGLKGGTPAESRQRPPWRVLMTSGIRAGRNPRILLSYGAAFIGRADVAIKGTFVSLWAITAGQAAGMTAAQSMARAGIVIAIMSLVSMVWVAIFGYMLDRVNRVTGLAIAMALAGLGYTSMWLITSPLDYAMLPAFVLLAIGQTSAIAASVTLVGQEALPKERGAIIAMNGFFGAFGILIAFAVGGRLFDSWGPFAPFVMVGLFQIVLFVGAIFVRLKFPGQTLADPSPA